MTDFKKQAVQAAIQIIQPGMLVGFGAGSTMAKMVDGLMALPELKEKITTASSSYGTLKKLEDQGFKTLNIRQLKSIDIYFDGCDQFDQQLNALKSGGGIHTTEKIMARCAKLFVLVGDEGKVVPQLTGQYPVVVEVLPNALKSVIQEINRLFPPSTVVARPAQNKDGLIVTEDGNYLLDVSWESLPNLEELNTGIKMITGVVEHSLFYQIAKKAFIAGENGVQELHRTL